MNDISRTIITTSEVVTPSLKVGEAQIDKISLSNVQYIGAKEAFIDKLSINELTVLTDEIEGDNGSTSETYEVVKFNDVSLSFEDSYHSQYLLASSANLTNDTDGKVLNLSFNVPDELGAKLVCRYLVLDLRDLDTSTNVAVIWPETSIKWLYGMPDIEAGYFYVLAFQRFAKDVIVGNVTVKI